MLYELLAGALPFDRKLLKQAGFAEIQRIIREKAPPRPSTRLSSLGERAENIAASRRTGVATLAKRLHKELEWIPLKAMRKERGHRYRSASELADDVQNYLSGVPLIAGPESAAYRMKKFVRRKRALVTGIAAVLVALSAGMVVSILFAVGQARARAQAEQRRAAEAVAAGLEAEQQAYLYFLPKEFLANAGQKSVFRMFLDGQSVIIKVVEDKLEGVPLTAASMRELLATMYRTLGEYKSAAVQLDRAHQICREQLGEENPFTLRCLRNLAATYFEEGRYESAEPLFVKTLETSRRALGEEHPNTLTCMTDLADLYSKQGLHEKAEALRLKAEPLLIKTLEGLQRVLGERHPGTLTFRNRLAEVYRDLGRYDEAEQLLVKGLEINRRVRGEEHPYTWLSRNKMIELYEAWGKPEKAQQWRARLGDEEGTEE
jgi:tetratricopeptide (TPR) repeat protein